ncbi:MAG: hypothetical protein PHE55_12575 [Methylococcaceae bacterium]|nr:hypothetical protein [Methylococcaceae bacterium]
MITEPKANPSQKSPEHPIVQQEIPTSQSRPEEYPYYIVPKPPIPGQTAWSIVPW